MYRDFDLKDYHDQEDRKLLPGQELIYYYAVSAYREVRGEFVFVGECRDFDEPTDEQIASVIRKFRADFAEVHKRYEALN